MMMGKGLAVASVLLNLTVNGPFPKTVLPNAAPVVAGVPADTAAARPAPQPQGSTKHPALTAVHVTGWVVQLPKRMQTLIDMSVNCGLTAIILEAKDNDGNIFFKMRGPGGVNYFQQAIQNCHAAGLKVIGRFCVLKDKVAEEEHPGMRYGHNPGSNLRHGPWTDPGCPETVSYNLGLIKELVALGVDEVNLDYIRYPSALERVHIDLPLPTKCAAIARLVSKIREITQGIRLSMDVFGYVAWDENSARVGQRIEDLAPHVDGIYPMLYPDHFARGDLGYKSPSDHPYEVIRRGCEAARAKNGARNIDIIPWIQCFTLHTDSTTYGPDELLAQIQGARDGGVPSYLVWNPRVRYEELERGLLKAKGKTSYAEFCRKYIPKDYKPETTRPHYLAKKAKDKAAEAADIAAVSARSAAPVGAPAGAKMDDDPDAIDIPSKPAGAVVAVGAPAAPVPPPIAANPVPATPAEPLVKASPAPATSVAAKAGELTIDDLSPSLVTTPAKAETAAKPPKVAKAEKPQRASQKRARPSKPTKVAGAKPHRPRARPAKHIDDDADEASPAEAPQGDSLERQLYSYRKRR